jgi:hypothetical protein
MKSNHLFLIAVLVLSTLSGPTVYASPLNIASPVHAAFGKSKSDVVRLNLRNDTSEKIDVVVGEQAMTLDPGRPVSVAAPVGTRIVVANDTPNHPNGSLISQITKELNGSTISIR